MTIGESKKKKDKKNYFVCCDEDVNVYNREEKVKVG